MIIIFSPKLPLKMWLGGFRFGCSYFSATKSRFLFKAKELIYQPPAIFRNETEDQVINCKQWIFFYPTQIIHWFIIITMLSSSLKDVGLWIGNLVWQFGKIFPNSLQDGMTLLPPREVREKQCHQQPFCPMNKTSYYFPVVPDLIIYLSTSVFLILALL